MIHHLDNRDCLIVYGNHTVCVYGKYYILSLLELLWRIPLGHFLLDKLISTLGKVKQNRFDLSRCEHEIIIRSDTLSVYLSLRAHVAGCITVLSSSDICLVVISVGIQLGIATIVIDLVKAHLCTGKKLTILVGLLELECPVFQVEECTQSEFHAGHRHICICLVCRLIAVSKLGHRRDRILQNSVLALYIQSDIDISV